jgi:hypothetical protein
MYLAGPLDTAHRCALPRSLVIVSRNRAKQRFATRLNVFDELHAPHLPMFAQHSTALT